MHDELDLSYLFKQRNFPRGAFYLEQAFGNKSVFIYGAGECSIWFFEIVRDLFGYAPSLVLDKKFGSSGWHEGVAAISPEEYVSTEDELNNAVVVICSGNSKAELEMYASAEALGFQNILFIRDIYEIHNPFSEPERLQTVGFDFYLEQKEKIMSAYELLEDDESRKVFHSLLQMHMQRKPVVISSRPRNEQYFPSDIGLKKGYSKFVSCGAYDGDSVRLLNSLHGKVEEIVCIEAEPETFKRLTGFLSESGSSMADRVISFPFAAYSHEEVKKFTSATGLGSRLSATGTTLVQCAALDNVLPNLQPTFISMDIEGAEPHALRGAEKIIKTARPDLGICVYHSPNHLWDIPLYLHSLNLGYRFYLRNYTSFAFETVLYTTT